MPEPITTPLLDLFPDTMTVNVASAGSDAYGVPVSYGASVNYRVAIIGRTTLVRDSSGQERTSTRHAIFASAPGLRVRDKYTLPARFEPREVVAIAVKSVTDENGPHHEVVYF